MTQPGKVYLVGAGPGDPGLLSLKAKACLERADAVVYDRLADPRILAHARPAAEMIYVGKASAEHTLRQPEINQLLVRLAADGKTVVRLKGGDPLVFGRGGEEALALQQAGIPFEFVPGITSAVAVAEYAGIPVTHRRVAASFAVITGHEDPGKAVSGINWQGLATAVDTLVFLMGVENIESISAKLIAGGRPASCPAAVIRWGTRPDQRTLVTTLGEAAADVQKYHVKPPAIFLVGEVVRLRDKLRWFDQKPLFGKTIVVTRACAQASALTAKLEELGARVAEVPAIRIVPPASYAPLDAAIAKLETYNWLIFTSANGVEAFLARLRAAGRDCRALHAAKIAAIGSGTARALAGVGITADLVPATYKAEELADALREQLRPGDRILLARAKIAREVLPERLRACGAAVDVVTAYETVCDSAGRETLLRLLEEGAADAVTFTSSSTVTSLLSLLGDKQDLLRRTALAVIGPVTAATCARHGLVPAITAATYTIDGLVTALQNYFKE